MKWNIGQDYGDIPDYPPLFARGTVEEEFVVVVGYEFIPGAWGDKQRGLAKVRSTDGTIRSVPPATFRQQSADERASRPEFGFEQEAFLRSRSEAPTLAAARALLAPVAGHPLFDVALELMACPIVAWSRVFPNMPMNWVITAHEGNECRPETISMQLRLDPDATHGHKALFLAWVDAKDDGWTWAERVPGTYVTPYWGSVIDLDSALACLVDGSHG